VSYDASIIVGVSILTSDTDCYGYAAEDIVVLVDRDRPGQIQPTRVNMVCVEGAMMFVLLLTRRFLQIREIKRLVEGAQSGDHFFFHCAWGLLLVLTAQTTPLTGVLKMQDIRFKFRIKITARKMEWMNVRIFC